MVRSPLVTVIIATYNRKHFVCEAIDSVLNQTYPNIELIVIDDGSTDGTGDLLRDKYGQRMRYVFQPNQGRSEARNHGIRLATGEYIAFLDSDDLWEPDKLARQIAFMQANPQYGLTHTFTCIIDSNGQPAPTDTRIRLNYHRSGVRSGYSYVAMARKCVMFLSTVIVRASLVSKIGCLDRSIPAFEDWDWYLRAALVTEIGVLTEPLTRYRLHDSNSTHPEFLEGERKTSQKHLELCAALPHPLRHRAQAHFYMHLVKAAYKEEEMTECARFLRKAAQINPWVLIYPDYIRYAAAALGPHGLITRLRQLKRSLQS